MNTLEHNWRIPAHCDLCSPCYLIRMRKHRDSHSRAYQSGRLQAFALGNPAPLRPVPASRTRTIRVPRSPLTVTIQLPDAPHPVAPDEPVRLKPGQRKRSFSHLQPSRNQFHAQASRSFNPQSRVYQ
ncbi:hypothetical protein F4776DRAFT_215902 [Hypoxylon sp. NC0597]|nr:hypothetical protein F4776DRAFT_215902 [Hypoxylon sp. NC0597]